MTLEQVNRLRALGLCVIPVIHKGKDALVSWRIYQQRKPSDIEVGQWFPTNANRNAAIVLGCSGLVVVETDSPEAEAIVDAAPMLHTSMQTRSKRGVHHYFRQPSGVDVDLIPSSFTVKGVTIEIKRNAQYVLAPGSVHPSGHVYTEVEPWPDSLDAVPLFPLAEILAASERTYGGRHAPFHLPEVIASGDRHYTLRDLMRSMLARGVPVAGALAACRVENRTRCEPPLPASELDAYLNRVARMPDRAGFERHPQDGWELAGALLEVGMSVDATLVAVRSVTPDFDPEMA